MIWAIQMPGFFLISGYFGRKHNPSESMGKVLLRKCRVYLLPLTSWYLIVQTLILGGNEHNILSALNTFAQHIDVTLWFLWVLFVLSVIFTGLNYILQESRISDYVKGVSYLAVIYTALLAFGMFAGINIMGIKFVLYYSIFYFLGYKIIQEKNAELWKRKQVNNIAFAISIVLFAVIIFNFDLYRCEDDLFGIFMRAIAGILGLYILFYLTRRYQEKLLKTKLSVIGKYTLEIYATHMYLNKIMSIDSSYTFNSVTGFLNFSIGFILCILFTALVIAIIKSNRITNLIFYGK